MKRNESKVMKELHKIREKIYGKIKNFTPDQMVRYFNFLSVKWPKYLPRSG